MDEKLRSELVREIREVLDRGYPSDPAQSAGAISDLQLQLAAAILMVWVVRADGASRQDEHRSLEDALERALGLGAETRSLVVRAAEEAADGAVPFAAVVERLARACSHEQRRRLVESLWQIAFADAELAGAEEYLVRKVSRLLGLSSAAFDKLR